MTKLETSEAPVTPVAGVGVEKKTAWLEMPGEYGAAGWRAQIWVNHPRKFSNDIFSADADRATAALQKVVLAHSGWLDFEGQPYPQPSDVAFWDAIPDELASTLILLVKQEAMKLPNSLLPTSRPSR